MQDIDEPETTIEQDEGTDARHVQHAQQWLNNHGRPSFEYMMKLAEDGSARSSEEIQELAQNYDINVNSGMSLKDIVHRIWTAMESTPDTSA